ncbi:MAG: NPCBM/NEW2 domain-containing protein [Puniceicoccales bacterium]|jgi:hypothetical protein|nr:NPCBM/NEW2 domain-containing protein [Puniceicoccales bacterium]
MRLLPFLAVAFLGTCLTPFPVYAESVSVEQKVATGIPAETLGSKQARIAAKDGKAFTQLPVNWKVRPEDKERAEKAWKIVCEAVKDQPQSDRKLHVVYVTFKDRPALENYHERYDHILKNIQAYYADQMRENGFPPLTFALDLDEQGKLIIHDAHVDMLMKDVTVRSSGPVSREAAKKVLAAKGIDIEKNHALVVCQLEDGIGPYYGGGSYKNGTGWTCDQANLDPRNFLSKEYFGGRYKASVGRNATIYIGGTAHELGHAFGMPHTQEGWEYPDCGRSLMGSGNHTYGNDLRGEGKGSFLVPTDALMLAAVPLFNGVESPSSSYSASCTYKDVMLKPVKDGGVLSGTISAAKPCYAVIVHLDPPQGHSDYDANAAAGIPDSDGKFSVEIKRPGFKGYLEMRVTAFFTDGTRNRIAVPAWITEEGLTSPSWEEKSYFSAVVVPWEAHNYSLAKEKLAEVEKEYGNVPAVKKALPAWKKALNRTTPEWAGTAAEIAEETKTVSLVDCKPTKSRSGYDAVCWDSMIPSDIGPQPHFIKGAPERFIMLHAVGHLTYDLGGKWEKLKTTAGMPFGRDGSIRIEVKGDDKVLFLSEVLKQGKTVDIDVSVKEVQTLQINIQDAGDGIGSDWAVIGDPVLSR